MDRRAIANEVCSAWGVSIIEQKYTDEELWDTAVEREEIYFFLRALYRTGQHNYLDIISDKLFEVVIEAGHPSQEYRTWLRVIGGSFGRYQRDLPAMSELIHYCKLDYPFGGEEW